MFSVSLFLFSCCCVLLGLWLQTVCFSLLSFVVSLELYSCCSLYLFSYGTWFGSLFGGLHYYSSTVIASLSILVLWFLLLFRLDFLSSIIWVFSLALKYGIAPFHWWVLWVYEHISWCLLLWILYLPKLALLWFSCYSFSFSFVSFLVVCWINIFLGSLTPFLSSSFKRFIVLTSLASFGMLLILLCFCSSSSDIVLSYYCLYTLANLFFLTAFVYGSLVLFPSNFLSISVLASYRSSFLLLIFVVSTLPPFILWSLKLAFLLHAPTVISGLVLLYSFLYSVLFIRLFVLSCHID